MLVLLPMRMLLMRMLFLMLLRSERNRPSGHTGRDGVTALGKKRGDRFAGGAR